MRALRMLWIALLLVGCSSAPARRDLLAGLERRVLANGLAVVVREDHRLPTVTVMLAYRVGSVNEDEPGLTGVSHFFEHMVFKGTEKYKRGDIDLVTYRCGGENNAFTTHDMTGYWFHVGASHLDEILDILADTMGNCTLDPREFDLERNTVLQEMNIWLDGPWGELERDVEKTVFTASRYRHPVLGWREDIEKLTRDRMMEYYKAFYKPNNASLIVLGDVDREDVFRRAGRRFESIPRGKDSSRPKSDEPAQKAERGVDLKTDKTADRLLMAFRTDRAGTDTDIALDVVSTILGDGRTSRLQARLVEKEDLAGEGNVSVSNYSRRHEGMFYVQVELARDAPLALTREVVVEELEALKRRPVSDRELRRAKNILRARFAFEAESQFEMAEKIGYFEALGLPDYVPRYMDRVEAVTAEAIQACAVRIFAPENRTVGVGHAKPKRAPVRAGAQGPPEFGRVWESKLENGLTVLVKPKRDLPVLAVHAFVEAGSLYEPEEKAGVAVLTGDLLDEGIDDGAGRRRTMDEIATEIEFAGGRFATGSSGASVKVLSEHAPLAFDLVRDVLRHPAFPEERVEKLREDTVVEIESQDDDPQGVAQRLFYEHAYKGHPMQRPSIGYKRTVEKLTRTDVVAHHRRFYRPENTIVSIAGDIDPERAIAEVRARFATWRGEGTWKPPVLPAAAKQSGPRAVHSTYNAQQVRVHMGHVGIERAHPDFFALRVMETILCQSPGFTNRLARIVRDEQGLAYDVAGSITGGAGHVAGPFQVVLGLEAKDKDRGLETVQAVMREFIEKGPTAREVEDARRYLLASFVSGWETSDDLAGYMLETRRYLLGADYAARFHRAVAAVSVEEVRRVARMHLDLKNLTLVVVGPVDKDGKLIEKQGDK